jgi:stearoyl-CoA desaturase (delta-9 desaturase)
MQAIGWAKVKKVPPKLQLGDIRPVADEKTLEAVITNRYEVMARYAREMRRACSDEISVLQARGQDLSILKAARRWLHRDDDRVPADARNQVDQARAASPALDKMLTMREELRQMWLNTSVSREQLTHDLQAWCKRAEDSGIARLQVFSQRLRAAHA